MIVATQLIPQLVTGSDRAQAERACGTYRAAPEEQEIRTVAERAIARDVSSVLHIVARLAADGLSLQGVLLDVIAPAARLLGAEWERDSIGWTETTVGLSTLERTVAVLARDAPPSELTVDRGLVVLFAEPGEQHTLSIRILGELFRQAGYRALVDPTLPFDTLVDIVQRDNVRAVCMTTTTGSQRERVRALVEDVRRFSRQSDILFLVGGAIENAAYARDVGATYCADFADALLLLRASARARGESLG